MPDCYVRVATDADVEKRPDDALRDIHKCAVKCGGGKVEREGRGNRFVEAWVKYDTQELCEKWQPELEKCLRTEGNPEVQTECK